jgi:ubiquinone/menaquinone biosynthesis C-methylase UbiE
MNLYKRIINRNPNDPLLFVKAHYSDPNIIKSYRTIGLLPSEEIIVDKFFRPGSTILDIGCGAGRTAIALANKGYEVTGIDFVPEMIEAAKYQAQCQNVPMNFMVMDVVDMRFPNESFQNALFSFNGFEQIPGKRNRKKVLKDMFQILKPGGCIILTARSGLAFGRRWLGWVGISLVYLLQKAIHGKRNKYEFGDKVWNGEYHHYLNPFYLKALVSNIGFKLLYFNSHGNIVQVKKPSFLTNFSNDKMLFYVLEKSAIPK